MSSVGARVCCKTLLFPSLGTPYTRQCLLEIPIAMGTTDMAAGSLREVVAYLQSAPPGGALVTPRDRKCTGLLTSWAPRVSGRDDDKSVLRLSCVHFGECRG